MPKPRHSQASLGATSYYHYVSRCVRLARKTYRRTSPSHFPSVFISINITLKVTHACHSEISSLDIHLTENEAFVCLITSENELYKQNAKKIISCNLS